jgi:hypothetical protein
MGNCGTCKHWGTGDLPPFYRNEHGDGQYRARDTARHCAELDARVSVLCDCSYEYSGDTVLSVGADFGCVLWEAKE